MMTTAAALTAARRIFTNDKRQSSSRPRFAATAEPSVSSRKKLPAVTCYEAPKPPKATPKPPAAPTAAPEPTEEPEPTAPPEPTPEPTAPPPDPTGPPPT